MIKKPLSVEYEGRRRELLEELIKEKEANK